MSPLLSEQASFIRLILRSPDEGDGWRQVSIALRRHVRMRVSKAPDLYEIRELEDNFQIRLSEEGRIIAKYI